MLKVRRATTEDLIPVFKLFLAMHQETDFRNITLDPEKTLHGANAYINSGTMFVVDDGSQIVGMMAGCKRDPWFSQEQYASEELLYVSPEYRGTRAAYLLLKAFMGWAESEGVSHIRAGVSTGTGDSAERLYEHFGMKRMGGNYVAHLTRS